MYLIRNREHVISKDDLIAAVWGRRVVTDAALRRGSTRRAPRSAIAATSSASSRPATQGLPICRGVRETTRSTVPQSRRNTGQYKSPDKPSIAVLPFQNMSDDPDQDYFADGLVEDIITALSRFRSLFVIARQSSFTYEARPSTSSRSGASLACATCWKAACVRRGRA